MRRPSVEGTWVKKLVFVALVVAFWFVFVNRERIFVRDPIASLARDGVVEGGAQIFINYDNDVLIENDRSPMYLNIVQHEQPVGAPDVLKCIYYLACLARGYPAPQALALPGARVEAMTSKQVRFRDEQGREAVVKLR